MKRRTKKEKLKEKEIKRIHECDKMQQNKVFITRNKAENDTRKVGRKLRRTNRTRPLDDLRKEKKAIKTEAVEKVNGVVFHASNKIKQHRCQQDQRQDCGWEDTGWFQGTAQN